MSTARLSLSPGVGNAVIQGREGDSWGEWRLGILCWYSFGLKHRELSQRVVRTARCTDDQNSTIECSNDAHRLAGTAPRRCVTGDAVESSEENPRDRKSVV